MVDPLHSAELLSLDVPTFHPHHLTGLLINFNNKSANAYIIRGLCQKMSSPLLWFSSAGSPLFAFQVIATFFSANTHTYIYHYIYLYHMFDIWYDMTVHPASTQLTSWPKWGHGHTAHERTQQWVLPIPAANPMWGDSNHQSNTLFTIYFFCSLQEKKQKKTP